MKSLNIVLWSYNEEETFIQKKKSTESENSENLHYTWAMIKFLLPQTTIS